MHALLQIISRHHISVAALALKVNQEDLAVKQAHEPSGRTCIKIIVAS